MYVSPKLRQYITWGNNLLGFTHGDGVRGMIYLLLMATEQRKGWGTWNIILGFTAIYITDAYLRQGVIISNYRV